LLFLPSDPAAATGAVAFCQQKEGAAVAAPADILGNGDTSFLEKIYGHSLPEYSETAANYIRSLFGGSDSRVFWNIRDQRKILLNWS